MIDKEIFDRIEHIYNLNKHNITHTDILSALTEELGEFSRAVRVEDHYPLCHNKKVNESSEAEIIDLMLVCVEAYIARGGKYSDMLEIASFKLSKWESLWQEYNERHNESNS